MAVALPPENSWVKGEESGNTQHVVGVYIDCDQDAVVVKVKQTGAACHNGFESCFYRQIIPAHESKQEKDGTQSGPGLELRTICKPVMDPNQLYAKK